MLLPAVLLPVVPVVLPVVPVVPVLPLVPVEPEAPAFPLKVPGIKNARYPSAKYPGLRLNPCSLKGPSCRENSTFKTPLLSTWPLNFNADCTDPQLCAELPEEVPVAPVVPEVPVDPDVPLVPEVPDDPLPLLLWATTMLAVARSRTRNARIAGK